MTVSTATDNFRPNSRQQQREDTRERILTAASRLFALRGYEGSSIGAIANAAGVKKALVQYHFGTKQALWESTINRLWALRNQGLSSYQPGGQSKEQAALLQAIYDQITQATHAQPQWLQILFNEAAKPGPRLAWLVENHIRRDFEQGLAFIRHAQQDKLMPDSNALDLLLLLSGALTYVLMVAPVTERVTGEDFTQPARLKCYLDTVHQLLLKA